MLNYALAQETLGYVTSPDPANTDKRFLIAGSQNTLIDYQKKAKIRSGYFRLGVANVALTDIRNAWTWNTSTGTQLPQRFYDDELEVYLGTIDTLAINAWTRVQNGWNTTKKLRPASREGGGFFNTTERIDVQPMVIGDSNMYEWNGAVAVVASVTTSTITKEGTSTFGGSRFYATRVTVGSSTTQFDITNPSGTTFRYTYDTTGTDPNISATTFPIGTAVIVQAQNFAAGNKGTFLVTGSGANYFEVTNAGGSAESNKTIGTGYIDIKSVLLNVRTGVQYGYTGGESTLTLTGTNDTTGIIAGDILIQKVWTRYNTPSSTFTNDIIYSFENQIVVGSKTSGLVYISKNTDYADFTFSSPRVPGEGALLTLPEPTRAINALGKTLLIFSGLSTIFKTDYTQITVGTTLAETIAVKKLFAGVKQGALNHESVIPVGAILIYLTNETTVKTIEDPNNVSGLTPKTFSNPIKPDFDSEDWDEDQTFGIWYKNMLIYTAGAASHMYMLNFVEDADGKLFRFWNPPQIFPVGAMSVIDSGNGPLLHGHSNVVPESYLLFDGASDGQYSGMDVANKLPINAIATWAYDDFKRRALLKTFDEYYVEGEITPNSKTILSINYDFGGDTQVIQRTVDGSDNDILEGPVGFNSLAQQSLALNPLGGLLNPPTNARKFHVKFEIAKEDFHKINASFSSNDIDQYWAIIADGPNATLSPRRDTTIHK